MSKQYMEKYLAILQENSTPKINPTLERAANVIKEQGGLSQVIKKSMVDLNQDPLKSKIWSFLQDGVTDKKENFENAKDLSRKNTAMCVVVKNMFMNSNSTKTLNIGGITLNKLNVSSMLIRSISKLNTQDSTQTVPEIKVTSSSVIVGVMIFMFGKLLWIMNSGNEDNEFNVRANAAVVLMFVILVSLLYGIPYLYNKLVSYLKK